MKNRRLSILLFLLSTFTLNATDLLVNRVIRPYLIEYQDDDEGFQVEFEVENANVLTAEEYTIDVTIKDELESVVFFETVQAGNLEPYSKTVHITEAFFLPELVGKYFLELDLEFSEDIDPSNNDLEMTFDVVEPPGFKLQPGMIHISQLNFTFENAQQEYSSYGLLSSDFELIAEASGLTSGFINMVTPEMGWVIQNMIFDLTSGYPGLSTMFNLGMEGPVTGIQASAYVSEEPLMEFSVLDYIDFNVGLIDYNSAGRNSPIGTIPAPIPHDSIKFKEGGKDDLVWQHGHVNIEQDVNQCGPASVANSFQWLENEQGLPVPHEHKPGIRDTSLVGEIDKAMERDEHDTVLDGKALSGKIKYIDDNNLTDSLKIKHKNRRGKSFVSNDTVKVGNTMSIPNTDTTSLIDWILQELKDGEDVELAIGWDGGGGHWVDLIGGGYVQGVPWLAWVHDANQGYDDMGTPADETDDTTKSNGGITPQTGGYGWSYIIDNKLASVVGNDTSRGTIDLAFSESIDTSKVTSVSEQFDESLIKEFSLSQNYPNPFNPTTVIEYQLPKAGYVEIKVFDAIGKEIDISHLCLCNNN